MLIKTSKKLPPEKNQWLANISHRRFCMLTMGGETGRQLVHCLRSDERNAVQSVRMSENRNNKRAAGRRSPRQKCGDRYTAPSARTTASCGGGLITGAATAVRSSVSLNYCSNSVSSSKKNNKTIVLLGKCQFQMRHD